MPAVVRKLLIVAAADGLLLSPQKQQKPVQPIEIKYGTREITSATGKDGKDGESFEAHGIVGLLSLPSTSYLIAISNREQVAQIKGKTIFVVSGVTLVPLSSHEDAKAAINQAKQSIKAKAQDPASVDSGTSDDEGDQPEVLPAEVEDEVASQSAPEDEQHEALASRPRKDSTIAQDVIGRKGQYGRFAARWFSKKGWTVDKRRLQGMSAGVTDSDKAEPIPQKVVQASKEEKGAESAKEKAQDAVAMLPKLLRTTKMLLSSRSFYYSYDYDITRRLGADSSANNELPLYKLVDPLFFWNRFLSEPFVDAGQHAYVLPLMQGFIGQKAFTVNTETTDPARAVAAVAEDVGEIIELQENASESKEFAPAAKTRDYLVTLLSRRSVMRPGLRYLRRGVDDEGNVANYVESEQILSSPSWSDAANTYSFTQIRGSIPLFFSQSPYSFKPTPILQHSDEVNHAAFCRHFAKLAQRYGEIQVAALVDKHGVEALIGKAFEDHAKQYNEETHEHPPKIGFEWFDFHRVCAGMKFENVNILMKTLETTLSSFGVTVLKNGKVDKSQSGVLRTNCMDCLDRTNVVQSATAQHALEVQLATDGIKIDLQADKSTQWYNALWADNGDAISKQYSSTAALKGDYTRTRKRDYRGALNDFGLTLSRYYNNIVNDYFSQTVIDYLLGNVTAQVFEDFESSMMSVDPGISMKKVRQAAIDTSAKIVIGDQSEELTGGWTVSTPRDTNTLRSFPFEEIVLLITDAALYAVRFDWNTEKVSSFERIDLRSIIRVRKGVYITNTFTAAQTDAARNIGLAITYKPNKRNLARVNTRSMSTAGTSDPDRQLGGLDIRDDAAGNEGDDNAVDAPSAPVQKANEIAETSREMQQGSKADEGSKSKITDKKDLRLLAFKALPARSSVANSSLRDGTDDGLSEEQSIADICAHLEAAVETVVAPGGKAAQQEGFVEEGDIISLAEARKSTGLVEWWGHSLKKLVWA